MKIGNKVIEYSVYAKLNGVLSHIGETSSLQLPSFENMTDTIKGAGIMGEIDFPTTGQVGAMAFVANFRNTTKELVQLYAPKAQEIEVRWLIDKLDKGSNVITKEAHKVFMTGMPKKFDPGKLEKNNAQESSYEMEVMYYNYTIDGMSILEIDKLNNVFVINGVDYMKDVRDAL